MTKLEEQQFKSLSVLRKFNRLEHECKGVGAGKDLLQKSTRDVISSIFAEHQTELNLRSRVVTSVRIALGALELKFAQVFLPCCGAHVFDLKPVENKKSLTIASAI